jgi:hypothetical protein
MSNKFDELSKSLAQSLTRRQAFRKFGLGLAGMALACFGLAGSADAANSCWPGGTVCFNAWNGGRDPAKDCRKCCNGYLCAYGICHCQ